MYLVSKLKTGVSGILSGLNLSNVTDLYGKAERAGRTLITKADVKEASGRLNVNLYDGVYDYGLSSAPIFGGVVYDLRPQGVVRGETDYTYKKYIEQFDRTKVWLPNGVQLTFEWRNGVPIMRASSARVTKGIVLDPMTSTSGFTVAGGATTIAQDNTDYYQAPASLRLSPAGATTTTVTKTIGTASISDYEDVAVGFLAVKIPTTANLTNIAVRVGSSASAHDEVTATQGFLGAWTDGEWLIVSFDFSGSTSTGTPNWSSISYLQIRFAHTGALTNLRIGGFWMALPTPYTLLYGSSAIWLASGSSSPLQTISADSDQILLNDAAYTLLEWEFAKEIAIGQGGSIASGLVKMIESRLDKELYPMYRADNPSEEIRQVGNYYDD